MRDENCLPVNNETKIYKLLAVRAHRTDPLGQPRQREAHLVQLATQPRVLGPEAGQAGLVTSARGLGGSLSRAGPLLVQRRPRSPVLKAGGTTRGWSRGWRFLLVIIESLGLPLQLGDHVAHTLHPLQLSITGHRLGLHTILEPLCPVRPVSVWRNAPCHLLAVLSHQGVLAGLSLTWTGTFSRLRNKCCLWLRAWNLLTLIRTDRGRVELRIELLRLGTMRRRLMSSITSRIIISKVWPGTRWLVTVLSQTRG